MNPLGRHLLIELYDCAPGVLLDTAKIEQTMCRAARQSGATIVQSTFHAFSPYGVSGVVVITESHLTIHTWPEYDYAAVDVFTCGSKMNPHIAYDILRRAFKSRKASVIELKRGQGAVEIQKKSSPVSAAA